MRELVIRNEQIRKIAAQFRRARNTVLHGKSLAGAEAFIVAGDVGPFGPAVVKMRDHERAADLKAELVLAESWLLILEIVIKEVGGVQLVVADKLPNGAVKLITAGLGDHVDVGARRDAELGVRHL